MNSIHIKLFNKEMGILRDENNKLAFNYYPSFIDSGIEPSPLHLPVNKNTYLYQPRVGKYQYGLPGLFADSLPDKFGNDLLRFYLDYKQISIDQLSALERLAYVGKRGMGALTYEPEMFQTKPGKNTLDIRKLMEISLLTEEHQKTKLSLEDIKTLEETTKINSSIGGRRAKLLISRKDQIIRGALALPEEGFNYEILKIIHKNHRETHDDGKIEYIYYQLAADCHINMMPCELVSFDGLMHFTTRRFDKGPAGEQKHIQSVAALENTDFNEQNFSVEHIIKHIMKNVISPNDRNQNEEMFKRTLFNIVAGNCDDHTKNTSLLMDQNGKWSLSPAYDITYNYASAHCTGINNKINNITRYDIQTAGNSLDIDKPYQILELVQDTFLKFERYAKDLDVSKSKIREIVITTNTIKNKIGGRGKNKKS